MRAENLNIVFRSLKTGTTTKSPSSVSNKDTGSGFTSYNMPSFTERKLPEKYPFESTSSSFLLKCAFSACLAPVAYFRGRDNSVPNKPMTQFPALSFTANERNITVSRNRASIPSHYPVLVRFICSATRVGSSKPNRTPCLSVKGTRFY